MPLKLPFFMNIVALSKVLYQKFYKHSRVLLCSFEGGHVGTESVFGVCPVDLIKI